MSSLNDNHETERPTLLKAYFNAAAGICALSGKAAQWTFAFRWLSRLVDIVVRCFACPPGNITTTLCC